MTNKKYQSFVKSTNQSNKFQHFHAELPYKGVYQNVKNTPFVHTSAIPWFDFNKQNIYYHKKTNTFSQSSKLKKNGTIVPDGITPESVRNAFGSFAIEAITSNVNSNNRIIEGDM